jgi:hypothetical protein
MMVIDGTCKGCYALGTACGACSRCGSERYALYIDRKIAAYSSPEQGHQFALEYFRKLREDNKPRIQEGPRSIDEKIADCIEALEVAKYQASLYGRIHIASCRVRVDELEERLGVLRAQKELSQTPTGTIVHGVNCEKKPHTARGGQGYLHSVDDDGQYDVDGVLYCGRCHMWLQGSAGPKVTHHRRNAVRDSERNEARDAEQAISDDDIPF